ncbi:MAG: VacB/RNase II family 3'-5' exoribonuclease [Phycisphaeraceae bacterium]|nr:MAG: VacB/RNase II family 3'-5' exoribonuclease [Phycisphaeraceae bacterium]
MPLRYKHRLMAHLGHKTYSPMPIEQLAEDLGIPEGEREDFKAAVEDLSRNGHVIVGDQNLVTLPPIGQEMVGTFKRNPRGFGFIIPSEPTAHGDLFVPAHGTMDAVTGDTVRAEVVRQKRPKPGESPFVGEIVEILHRKQTAFTGELVKRGGQWLVFPDGSTLTDPVAVADAESKNAKEGDKVVLEIVHYPDGDALAEGVITKVLGATGEPNVETQAVMEAYGLVEEFPRACVDEALQLSIDFNDRMKLAEKGDEPFDPAERLDIRNDYIITIDPPDAKDYDDALSIERITLADGKRGWRLGVHIADVAHFVTVGSALDEEAKERCNSVYLPRKVIPMLPEVLSNGICSLQEGVGRFAKTAYMDYDEKGNVRARGYSQTIIQSAKRLTYLEAQAIIDGDENEARKHARTEPKYTDRLRETLREMNTLSRIIRKRRQEQGMIHLDLPEVELVYDDTGRVVDAVPEDDAYTHTLIEMFMVEANEAVARLFEDMQVPVLRRIHPDPVPGSMDQLRDFVKVAGFKIPKAPTREELQGLLEATKGSPAAPAIHFAVLRTLTKAVYSPALVGHFALASEAYSHFTSPIRRYPDLTVHRALAKFLEMTDNGTNPPRGERAMVELGKRLKETEACPDEQTLVAVGGKCNYREENATQAERELRQFLVLQLLSEHVGGSFPGLVTGVANAGVFVRLDKYLAEGLVKSEDLPATSGHKGGMGRALWRLDRQGGGLVEQNSGRSFNIGHRVEVTVLGVDLARRQMSLAITDAASREVGKKATPAQQLAGALRLGDMIEEERKNQKTGADKRAQRSKSRDKRKSDFRGDRKGKGKRQ